MQTNHHAWSVDDDIVAIYLCLFGDEDLGLTLSEVARKLGIGAGTLKMRISNFNWLHRGEGLNHPAMQSKEVYRLHKDTRQDELKVLTLDALAKSPAGTARSL